MTVNTPNNMPGNGEGIYEAYSGDGAHDNSLSETRFKSQDIHPNHYDATKDNLWEKPYKIPIKVVRSKINRVKADIEETMFLYEEFLEKIYIDPFVDGDLEECHFHIWKEIKKNYNEQYKEYIADKRKGEISVFDEQGNPTPSLQMLEETPRFIPYFQYTYAEDHGCRACRKFVKEYDKLISHSVFVNIFDFRYYLKLLLHEANCISDSLTYDFGEDYQDEAQEQTAEFYFSWAKMAENHTRLLTEQVSSEPEKLPASEVDYVSQKQAAQFQTFFSIRVASYTETIDNLIFSMQKDLVDTCDTFYKRYVSPALRFKTRIASSLEFEIETTSFLRQAPVLSEEVISVVNAMKGNFGSILTDMVQRRNNLAKKFDYFFSMCIQRKKYINYIDQLSSKGSSRPKVILDVKEDIYSDFFKNIYIDQSERMTLSSSHGNLDNLEENHHPQYLLRSGGMIDGNIEVADGITIDGVDISHHAHTGHDGSHRILSTDIDYNTPRLDEEISNEENEVFSVSIDSFSTEILPGGVPVVDVAISLNIDDASLDKYEYEIIYKEN